MSPLLKKFTRSLLVFSAFVEVAGLLLHYFFPKKISSGVPWLIVFFMVTTWIIYYLTLKSGTQKFISFANRYLLFSMGKMFLYAILVGLYIHTNRADAVPFTITVLGLYFTYLVFESIWMQRIRNLSPPQK